MEAPKKRHFRQRAHSNVLNNTHTWFPAAPDKVPWKNYYPRKYDTLHNVTFVDIGCGFGSLLLTLADTFKDDLVMGIEIRAQVIEYVQRRVLAARHEAANPTNPNMQPAERYENLWAVHNNAQRFMPNFFEKEQLTKVFICFPDPHFKKKNQRRRVITKALLAEYSYCMAKSGLLYIITDVAELMEWMVRHVTECPLFERLSNDELKSDPAVPLLVNTDEGKKVQQFNGNMYIAVYRKRDDPTSPREECAVLDNSIAAAAAADAGYTPKEGGETRGRNW